MVDQGMGLYSQNFYQNQHVLPRSIYTEPVLTSREECNVFADLFLIYLCLSRDFVNQHFFWLLDLHWDSPKLPWEMQRICGPFVLKTIIMPFKRRFVLWHSLIGSLYLNLYYYTSDTFRLIVAHFTHFTLHQFFLVYITTQNIFLIPDDAVSGNLIIIFNFSSQGPHLK